MRKLNLLMGLSILSLVGFFTSCSTKDALGPSLEITSKATDTVPANSILTISWRANAGDVNLKTFTIKEGNSAVVDEDGNDWTAFDIPNADNEHYVGSARVAIGTTATSFELIATDKSGLTATKTVNVVIEKAAVPPTDKGNSLLGAGGSSLGSYYSASTNTVYHLADAKTNFAILDIVFTSNASSATFISPKDAASADINKSGRITKFQKVTTIDFNNATEADIDAINPSAESITVALNDDVVFKTQDNIKGIFKVDQLTVAADGTVTIHIKVKQ
jgi:hypothetical protein